MIGPTNKKVKNAVLNIASKGVNKLSNTVGMILVHPSLMSAYDFPKAVEAGKAIPHWDLFGLHINQVGYQGQVLPMLVAAYILATIEKGCTKIIPNAAPKNGLPPNRFDALKPIKIGNSVNGALAKTLIISANPAN